MNHARILCTTASLALLAACGGSSGNAALSKSFNYGAPQAPSQAEQSAATSAQSSLQGTASFSTAPDSTKGLAIISMADTLANASLGGASFGVRAPDSHEVASAIRQASTTDCAVVAGTTITFNSCSLAVDGFTITLNGSITSTTSSVTWSISGTFAGSANGTTLNVSTHQAGSMAVTASKITGSATSDVGGSANAQGQTINFGLATAAVIDLTYQTTPSYCVTAGTVEVKRVWTQRPNGATGNAFADVGVKLAWSGCNAVQVSHSH